MPSRSFNDSTRLWRNVVRGTGISLIESDSFTSLGISGYAISSRRIDIKSNGIDFSDRVERERERERKTVSIGKRFSQSHCRPKVMYLSFFKLRIRANGQINDSYVSTWTKISRNL